MLAGSVVSNVAWPAWPTSNDSTIWMAHPGTESSAPVAVGASLRLLSAANYQLESEAKDGGGHWLILPHLGLCEKLWEKT